MILDKFTQFKYFEIWAPTYSKQTVKLAAHKVGEHNKIVFTKAPSMGTDPYYVSGRIVKKCNKVSNGTITCYEVPISALEPLEINQRDLKEIW